MQSYNTAYSNYYQSYIYIPLSFLLSMISCPMIHPSHSGIFLSSARFLCGSVISIVFIAVFTSVKAVRLFSFLPVSRIFSYASNRQENICIKELPSTLQEYVLSALLLDLPAVCYSHPYLGSISRCQLLLMSEARSRSNLIYFPASFSHRLWLPGLRLISSSFASFEEVFMVLPAVFV